MEENKLTWTLIGRDTARAPIPSGYLIKVFGVGITYVPDPKHEWEKIEKKELDK